MPQPKTFEDQLNNSRKLFLKHPEMLKLALEVRDQVNSGDWPSIYKVVSPLVLLSAQMVANGMELDEYVEWIMSKANFTDDYDLPDDGDHQS